jgi:hypothetical protein
MAHKEWLLALTLIASPVSAAGEHPAQTVPAAVAPAGTPQTKYCMYIEAITGSRLEEVKCWTREEWAERGVDVDQDWPKEGVRTIG